MKESTLIETVDALFVFATLFLVNGLSIYVSKEHSNRMTKPQHKQERFQVREKEPEPFIDYKRNLKGASDFKDKIDSLDVFIDSIEYEYIGTYFVTAYCPAECGYVEYSDGTDNFPKGWVTASDTICHYSESNWEPTTCAIDRNYFGFEEVIAIDFDGTMKTYVTEDTGAFRGKWIDCFVETMYEVQTWGTGYYPVYTVEFRTNITISHFERKKRNEWLSDFNYSRCFGDRIPCRDDC